MPTRSWRAASVSVLCGALAYTALGGVQPACYIPLWSGLTQSTGGGAEQCAKYTNCPVSIKCYPGGPYLVAGDVTNETVSCKKYVGGTWDPQNGRCVGGESEETDQTVTIPVQACTNGCN